MHVVQISMHVLQGGKGELRSDMQRREKGESSLCVGQRSWPDGKLVMCKAHTSK